MQLDQLISMIENKDYAKAYFWASEALTKMHDAFSKKSLDIIQSIVNISIEDTILELNRINCQKAKRMLSENVENVNQQWRFCQSLNSSDEYINIIIGDTIFILKSIRMRTTFNTLKRFMRDPNNLYIAGKGYTIVAMSSIDNINSIVKQFNDGSEKFIGIATFINSLNEELQIKLSKNHIGIIISDNKIYLLKWIQYFDQSKLNFSGKGTELIDSNFGAKIGLEVREDLSLGEMIIFTDDGFKPLFSISDELLGKKKVERRYDLKNSKDSDIFISEVMSRIESGVVLITKSKEDIKNPAELDQYIKISLQRLNTVANLRQRIYLLRDLLSLNMNPDNIDNIVNAMKINYVEVIKEITNYDNLKVVLNEVHESKIFDTATSLILSIVKLFDSVKFSSESIIDTIKMLSSSWKLTDHDVELLETPQITAMTDVITQILSQSRNSFADVIKYVDKVISENKQLQTKTTVSLLLKILSSVFATKREDIKSKFEIQHLFSFLDEIKSIANEKSRIMVEDSFKLFSNDVDFIRFLGNKIEQFISYIATFKNQSLSNSVKYRILSNMVLLSPLVSFRSEQMSITESCFKYIKKIDKYLALQYATAFIEIFRQSHISLISNPNLLKEASRISSDIKDWIKSERFDDSMLVEFRRSVKRLLDVWYLGGNLPDGNFDAHKGIIKTWSSFVNYENYILKMTNAIYIKDFESACFSKSIIDCKKKYEEIPDSVFDLNYQELLLSISKIFDSEDYDKASFETLNNVFKSLQKDYIKFRFNSDSFTVVKNKYFNYVINSIFESIEKGDSNLTREFFEILGSDIIYTKFVDINKIIESIPENFANDSNDAKKFADRFNSIDVIIKSLSDLNERYEIEERKRSSMINTTSLLPRSSIDTVLSRQKEMIYNLFISFKKWILRISDRDQIRSDLFHFFTIIFDKTIKNIENKEQILHEINDLIVKYFESEDIVITNKETFFKYIAQSFPEAEYKMFYPRITDYQKFIRSFNNLTMNYNALREKGGDPALALDQASNLLKFYDRSATLWFYKGNCEYLLRNLEEALKSYFKSLGLNPSFLIKIRVVSNIIATYEVLGKYDALKEFIKNLDQDVRMSKEIEEKIKKVQQYLK